MPKKQRNSFYFFMVDYKKKEENSGRRLNGGLAEIQDEAGEIWKTMPASARAKYDKMAKDFKCGPQARKYTSLGEPIDNVLQRKREIEERDRNKKAAVYNLISDRKSALDKSFFVIDCNYYCETKDRFVINEMACASFNVREGLKLVYTKIIDPVTIPLGFTYMAKESEEEHCFKLPPLEMGESNISIVLSEMLDFIQTVSDDQHGVIPLFTLEKRSRAVESFLQQLSGIYEEMSRFALYPLSTLFFVLSQKLSVNREAVMPQESIASIALEADKFQYSSNLGCDYHEQTDKYFNCAKARVKRWVYTILDQCCKLANIEPISGDHVPDDVDAAEAYRIRSRREEEREERQREMREQEANVKFSFVDYANLDEQERLRHDAVTCKITPIVAPLASRSAGNAWSAPVASSSVGDAWPALGAPTPKTPVEKPMGVWGKPAEAKAQAANRPSSSASSSVSEPAKRAPLRRPGCEPEVMFAKLSVTGADSIGIARGRGRGSVTSIYNS